jgi:hypothetical protein
MSHDPKINELEQLLQSTDPSEAGFDGKAARAAVLLDELADVLRDRRSVTLTVTDIQLSSATLWAERR